jgi:hypothetical protein
MLNSNYSGQNFQIQLVKAMLAMGSGVEVTEQECLVIQTSGSTFSINGLAFKDTSSNEPFSLNQGSEVRITNLTLASVTAGTHLI